MSNSITLVLVNDIAEIERMSQSLEQFAETCNMIPKAIFDANLVLEEIVTNVISYAYDDGKQHEIQVDIGFEEGLLKMKVTDDGREFNPLEKEDPDVDKPLEEREIGGLGIYFVRQLMDHVEYRRDNNRNILIMDKNYRASA